MPEALRIILAEAIKPMDFDYLRLISLDERESGKLSSISADTYDIAGEYLAELYEEAKSIDHFMTKRGSELIDEIESVQSVLQTIIDQRFKKIIKLAENQTGTGRVDKEELKMLIPVEREMYDEILEAIGKCRDKITGTCTDYVSQSAGSFKHRKKTEPKRTVSSPEIISPVIKDDDFPIENKFIECTGNPENPDKESLKSSDEYEIVYIKENIDSFMGLDGHIYSLSAEDVVSLPVQNASVLCGRNIALNIRVSK